MEEGRSVVGVVGVGVRKEVVFACTFIPTRVWPASSGGSAVGGEWLVSASAS